MKRTGYAYLYVNLLFMPFLAISYFMSNFIGLLMALFGGMFILGLLSLCMMYLPTISLFLILRKIGWRFGITKEDNKSTFKDAIIFLILYHHVGILFVILIASWTE